MEIQTVTSNIHNPAPVHMYEEHLNYEEKHSFTSTQAVKEILAQKIRPAVTMVAAKLGITLMVYLQEVEVDAQILEFSTIHCLIDFLLQEQAEVQMMLLIMSMILKVMMAQVVQAVFQARDIG